MFLSRRFFRPNGGRLMSLPLSRSFGVLQVQNVVIKEQLEEIIKHSTDARSQFLAALRMLEVDPLHPLALQTSFHCGKKFLAFDEMTKALEGLSEIFPEEKVEPLRNEYKKKKMVVEAAVAEAVENEKHAPAWFRWSPVQGLADYTFSVSHPGQVDQLREQWDDIRTKYGAENALSKACHVWGTYAGEVEGVYRLTEGLTRQILLKGVFPTVLSDAEEVQMERGDVVNKEDVNEIIHEQTKVCYQLAESATGGHMVLSVQNIRDTHRALLRKTPFWTRGDLSLYMNGGSWKVLPNTPTRNDRMIHQYCPPNQVDKEMQRIVELFNEASTDEIVKLAWLHHVLSATHPFTDGNGRMCRAMVSAGLFGLGLPPFVVRREGKSSFEDYRGALEVADFEKDITPLVSFFLQSLSELMEEVESLLPLK